MVLTLILTLAVAQNAEESRLAGRWRDADLQLVSEFTRAADGTWSAVVVASPRRTELGKRTFGELIWQEKARTFTGKLIKPDDGQVVDVALTLESVNAMTGEAGVFIFKKTLHFARVVEDGGLR